MVYLIGASGHAKVIIEILEELDNHIGGLQDSNPTIKKLLNYEVHQSLPNVFDASNDEVIISIGSNVVRKKIALTNSYNYISVVHPAAYISKKTKIDIGTVIMAGVSINSDVKVGNHCIINTNASVDHDCVLEDFVHISPNVALAGNVVVGEGTHIGIGACVIQGITIGRWCTIGAGAVIINDIPDGATVVGNPGRIIKRPAEG